LPESVTNSLEEGQSCVAGAMTKEDYLDAICSAGFEEIEILSEKYTSEFREPPENQEDEMKPKIVVDGREMELDLTPAEVESLAKAVLAVNIKAIKPQQENQAKSHIIPFKLSKTSNHISVPVFVNEKGPFDFTLDTGATATTLSKSLADELGVETYDDDKEETRAIGIPHKSAKVKSLTIGPDTFKAEEILVIDFATVLGPHGTNVKGVIGHTTLKEYKMSVNYRTKMMSLEKNINGESLKDERIHWTGFEYIEDSHLVGVPVFINGSGPFTFVVDTGAGGTVITSQLAEKLELSLDSSDVQVLAPGGGTGGNFAVLEQLSVASAVQENASVVVLDLKAVSPRGGLIHNGILGYPFLKDYETVIDYPNKNFAFINQRGKQ
ncbi:MAG: aspartyl protease family protein, partial [Candidatus Hodarchaeales archaeon]